MKVANLNEAVATIAKHSFEQAAGLQQVDAAMAQADQVMHRTLGIVEKAAAAAAALADEIAQLQAMIDRFQVERAPAPSRGRRATMQAAE